MNSDCLTCRDVACSHCGFHGYRALTEGWDNPYRCPKCWLTTGLTMTPVRHSTRGKHYQWLPLSRDRHCPTCRCGRDSDPVLGDGLAATGLVLVDGHQVEPQIRLLHYADIGFPVLGPDGVTLSVEQLRFAASLIEKDVTP